MTAGPTSKFELPTSLQHLPKFRRTQLERLHPPKYRFCIFSLRVAAPPGSFATVPVTLAFSLLCENPLRRTGLTTLFDEFLGAALRLYPEVNWILFAGPNQPMAIESDPRVTVIRQFPANDRRGARLLADHFQVGPTAKRLGAAALLTVGFVPLRAPLPVVMHIFSLHHANGGGGWRGAYRRRALERGLRRAKLVIVNSQWTAQTLYSSFRYKPSCLLVSQEGLQHDRFSAQTSFDEDAKAGAALGLPEKFLLWSSNFYPYKRADRALAAYAALPPEFRETHRLVLIGGDWEGGLARAKADAERLGVGDQAQFLGWVEDRWLPACYRGATLHLLSTTEETFGRSVLEAMGCGCPCVLQELPVLREVAADAAEYVDFANAEESARILRQVAEDEAHRAKLREAGQARAKTFSFEKLARERIDAILTALKK